VVVYGVGAERLGLSYYPSIHHEACGERSRVGGLSASSALLHSMKMGHQRFLRQRERNPGLG